MKPEEILSELERIAKQSGHYEEFADLITYVNKCFDPSTKTHLIDVNKITRKFVQLPKQYILNKKGFYDVLQEALVFLDNLGYVGGNLHLTYQEHRLVGGTEQDERILKNPYMPIGLAEGKIGIDKARKSRELDVVSGSFPKYFGLEKLFEYGGFYVNLEPLDDDGNTIRDPVPLDKELNPILNYKKSEDFPFKRQ